MSGERLVGSYRPQHDATCSKGTWCDRVQPEICTCGLDSALLREQAQQATGITPEWLKSAFAGRPIALQVDEDGDILGTVIGLDGCLTHAANLPDVLAQLKEAQDAWLAAGSDLPTPPIVDLIDIQQAVRNTQDQQAEIERHDCEAWAMEGIGCAICNPAASERQRLIERAESAEAQVEAQQAEIQRPLSVDATERVKKAKKWLQTRIERYGGTVGWLDIAPNQGMNEAINALMVAVREETKMAVESPLKERIETLTAEKTGYFNNWRNTGIEKESITRELHNCESSLAEAKQEIETLKRWNADKTAEMNRLEIERGQQYGRAEAAEAENTTLKERAESAARDRDALIEERDRQEKAFARSDQSGNRESLTNATTTETDSDSRQVDGQLPYERFRGGEALAAAFARREGEHLLARHAFRWHLDGRVIPNCYEMFERDSIISERGWEIVHTFGPHIAVVREKVK